MVGPVTVNSFGLQAPLTCFRLFAVQTNWIKPIDPAAHIAAIGV